MAEVELITTTVRALSALGLSDLTLKLNDRRPLTALLQQAEAPEEAWGRCLIAVDKLDKIGMSGVVEEVGQFLPPEAVSRWRSRSPRSKTPRSTPTASGNWSSNQGCRSDRQPRTHPLRGRRRGRRHWHHAAVRWQPGAWHGLLHRPHLRAVAPQLPRRDLRRWAIRRDDGRLSGADVPACGFSIGFERIVDLVDLGHGSAEQIAVVYDRAVDWGRLLDIQQEWVGRRHVARLVPRPKRLAGTLDSLAAEGFASWVEVTADGGVTPPRALSPQQ